MDSEYRVNDASDTNETAIIQYASIARFNFSAKVLCMVFLTPFVCNKGMGCMST